MAASSLQFRELGMVNGADENLEILLGGKGEDKKPESLLKVMRKDDEAEILNLEEGFLAGDDDASSSLNGSASPSIQPVTPPNADISTAATNRKTVSSLQKHSPAIKPGKTRPSTASNPKLNPSSANIRGIVRSHSSRSTITAPRKTPQTPSINSTVAVRKPAVTSNRPASATRGRPNSTKVNPRQQSCSPARLRNDYQKPGNMVVMAQRSKGSNTSNGDEVNPVLIGTKMVERVVNMRKLAPPKHEERPSLNHDKKTGKDSSGFGRSFSKKSLEMAIRHMDIGRSIANDFARNSESSNSTKSLSKPKYVHVHNQQK